MLSSTFESFYQKAKNKADEALNAVAAENLNFEELSRKAVDYMSKTLSQTDRNSFEYVAVLDEEKGKLLKANDHKIKLSLQSFIKNIIRHPEITMEEYFLLPEMVDKTGLLIYVPPKTSQMEKLICFCFTTQGKYYEAVIKATGNKHENYLQSFHRTNLAEIEREKKKKGIKIIYENLT